MADPVNRILAAFKALLGEAMPNRDYLGVYRYTVSACDYDNQTIDAEPVNASATGMPAVAKVPLRSPLKLEVNAGEEVGIGFLDSDPTQPYVATLNQNTLSARAQLRSSGETKIGETAASPVARQGDLAFTPLLGVQVMFAALPTGDIVPTPMMTMTPYFIAAGSILTVPPAIPSFPSVGQFIGFTSSASPLARVP